MSAFEYQLGADRISVIEMLQTSMFRGIFISLMSLDDGPLRFANVLQDPFRLCLWLREKDANGAERWAHARTIDLETLLPDGALVSSFNTADVLWVATVELIGFAEDTDVIFLLVCKGACLHGDVYMIQLNLGRATKVLEGVTNVFPYTNFCIPGICF
ncbi:hypothetical protein C2845_PM05G11310 [Panicum miliaceum]|uniref:Uncharacterized protein n=1 Tax=Panicum miliaceum TaxID=4540 RepID=A0A3L6SV42_PANMI|nr:hypothetical protein C2845_PM05G11310 [Panicum miliaceum]